MQEDGPLVWADIDIDTVYPVAQQASQVEVRRQLTSGYRKVQYDERQLMSIETFVHLVDRFGDNGHVDRSSVHVVELSIWA